MRMSTYAPAPRAVHDLKQHVLMTFADHQVSPAGMGRYREIIESRLQIDLLMAHADIDPETQQRVGDALKLHGVKALGICSIVNLKTRTRGLGDVLIELDGDWWDEADDEARMALLDHELTHIDFKREKNGVTIQRDDLNRPLVKMRPHHFEVGWFAHVAMRHGQHSLERKAARLAFEEFGQAFWPQLVEQTANRPEAFTEEARCNAAGMSRSLRLAVGIHADQLDEPTPGGLSRAMENFADLAERMGGTVTITGGGHSVTLTGDQLAKAAAKGT